MWCVEQRVAAIYRYANAERAKLENPAVDIIDAFKGRLLALPLQMPLLQGFQSCTGSVAGIELKQEVGNVVLHRALR